MRKKKIIFYGNKTLEQESVKVDEFGDSLQAFTDEMFEILSKSNGIGLAAPQIGVLKQVVVIDLTPFDEGPKIALINPEIVWYSDNKIPYEEGCLSVPGIYQEIFRPDSIKVKAQNVEGKKIEFKAEDVLARVIQHEVDHLHGKLFINYVTPEQMKEIKPELAKIKKLSVKVKKKI